MLIPNVLFFPQKTLDFAVIYFFFSIYMLHKKQQVAFEFVQYTAIKMPPDVNRKHLHEERQKCSHNYLLYFVYSLGLNLSSL